jgi:hypothetical protein
VTTTLAVIVTIAVLAAAGALPARMIAGWRPATPFIAPIGGAVLAGTAGELTVLVDGTELGWFIPLAIAANAAATASWLARRESRRSKSVSRPRFWLWIAGGAGVFAVAAAAAWSMRGLASAAIGVDAKSIWLAHATWISNGHATAIAALTNPGLSVAHSSYPPLGGAAIALGWVITGLSSAHVGQLVLAVLTGCAVAACGASILEVGMVASVRSGARRNPLFAAIVMVMAGAASAAWVLGAYGFAGAGATNGSMDLFAAAAAVGAAGLGLVLPCGGEHGRAAAVLAVAAGMATNEGIAAAAAVFVLIGARWLTAPRRGHDARVSRVARHRGVIGAIASAVGVGGVIAWPIGAAVRRATPNLYLTGPRIGSFFSRADSAVRAMGGDLHLAGIALGVGVLAALALGRARRAMGLGSDAWLWILGVVELLAVGGLYVIGDKPVAAWLHTSVGAVTLFADCLGLGLLAWWCVIATATVLGPRAALVSDDHPSVATPEPSAPSPEPVPALPPFGAAQVDAGGDAVLHPGP